MKLIVAFLFACMLMLVACWDSSDKTDDTDDTIKYVYIEGCELPVGFKVDIQQQIKIETFVWIRKENGYAVALPYAGYRNVKIDSTIFKTAKTEMEKAKKIADELSN